MSGPRIRTVLRWALEAVLIAAVLGSVLLLRPGIVSSPVAWVVVAGASMEPTYASGDVVVVRRRDAYEVGDAIAYRVPEGEPGEGIVVIHRIVGGDGVRGYAAKGDNKDDRDPWYPRDADVVGSAVLHVPRVGLVAGLLRTPLGIAALAAAVTFAILAFGAESERRRRDEVAPARAQPRGRPRSRRPAAPRSPGSGPRTRQLTRSG